MVTIQKEGITPDSQNADHLKLADEFRRTIVDIQSKLYDKATAYTNLVMLGGYAGSFTLWSYTKQQLPPRATIYIALWLGASLVGFVLYQVYKIAMQIKHFTYIRYLLSPNRTLPEFFEEYNRLERLEAEAALSSSLIAVFVIVFCLITALCALGLLFLNFCFTLLGVAGWPS
jgi:hypothetical protein